MRNIFNRIYILLLLSLMLSACAHDVGLNLDDVLTVSCDSFQFNKEEASEEFIIESYCSWKIKCNEDWVIFLVNQNDEGKFKNVLSVTVNKSPIDRFAVAEIYNVEYGVNVKIDISQKAGVPYINCSRDSINVVSEDYTEEITINSNIPWNVSSESDWLEINPLSGDSGERTLNIIVGKNTLENPRSAIITISNSDYGVSKDILVSQMAFVPELDISCDKIDNVSYNGSTEEITIDSNIPWEVAWEVSGASNWLEINPLSGDSGERTLNIIVGKNTLESPRYARIIISNRDYGVSKDILVSQKAFVPEIDISCDKIDNISYNGSTVEITIDSNIPWEVSSESDWLEINPLLGDVGETILNLNVGENTLESPRCATITISNNDYGISKDILISQLAFVPELVISCDRFDNVSFVKTTIEVTIDSNIPWEVSSESDWLEINPLSGDVGETILNVVVDENKTSVPREALITIVNYEYEIIEEIVLMQSEYNPQIIVSQQSIDDVSFYFTKEEVTIESTIPWEVSSESDWVHMTPSSGKVGSTILSIEIEKNLTDSPRTATILISNSEYDVVKEISVYQSEHILLQTINGHEYVDLGLPSGLKWAACNVGADYPYDYGHYYAWGEVDTKSEYSAGNSKTFDRRMSDISGNATYDVARAKWGSSWRIPTKEELQELIVLCEWKWTNIGGFYGYKVIGPNRNFIFLPAGGYIEYSSRELLGECGFYWSSTPAESTDWESFVLFGNEIYLLDRYFGQSVRPVSE